MVETSGYTFASLTRSDLSLLQAQLAPESSLAKCHRHFSPYQGGTLFSTTIIKTPSDDEVLIMVELAGTAPASASFNSEVLQA